MSETCTMCKGRGERINENVDLVSCTTCKGTGIRQPKPEKTPKTKLAEAKHILRVQMLDRLVRGEHYRDVAAAFGVSPSTTYAILNDARFTHEAR